MTGRELSDKLNYLGMESYIYGLTCAVDIVDKENVE